MHANHITYSIRYLVGLGLCMLITLRTALGRFTGLV